MFLDSSEEDNAEYTSLTMFLAAIGLHDWAPKVGILSKLWRPKRDFRKSIPIQNSCWIDEMGVKPKNIFKKQIMYKITILWDFARDLISLKKKKSPQTIQFFHFFLNAFSFYFQLFSSHLFSVQFIRERIDLEALMLLSETDLGEVWRLVVTMLMTSAYKS